MVRCARLRRIMRKLGWWCCVLLFMLPCAWVLQVMVCAGIELKPRPWSPSYHAVVRDCAENGWFSVTRGTLWLCGFLAATYVLTSEWDERRRRTLQKESESRDSATGKGQ